MNIIVTGAAGFLGERVTDALLATDSPLPTARLVLVDAASPRARADPRVTSLQLDLAAPGAVARLPLETADLLLHLAAVVSGHAEEDFDYGMRVNFDLTRELLEAARRRAPRLRLVFASTVGVFGGDLPPVVGDGTAATPQNSYGTAKAMSELLLNDYARRGFVDARAVRLPTVSVRAGAANRAVTSFASGVVREPLSGQRAVCPVPPEQELWLTSPRAAVCNLLHAGVLPAAALGAWRIVNLPGISVTVADMVRALREVAGERIAALVHYEPDDFISRMVGSFPSRFDNERALRLGFVVDDNFTEVIRAYIRDDLRRRDD